MIYIGAENLVSPLGNNLEEHISLLEQNISGIRSFEKAGFHGEDLYLARIPGLAGKLSFRMLLAGALRSLKGDIDETVITSGRTLVLISSTKGELANDLYRPFSDAVRFLADGFGLAHTPWVISNACISGVHAINTAHDLLGAGRYEHAIVIGCDVLSDFVIFGFQSLFAISDMPCRPFDKDRNGVTLGEGCAVVVLSRSAGIFRSTPHRVLGGTSSNDANHISGPSRTGEGLCRTVARTLQRTGVPKEEIGYISAHGTGTVFNDEMEAIAFHRLGLDEVPLNSMKGYFGHTLGAAGVMECVITLQSMRAGLLYRSLGFSCPGTYRSLNILTENHRKPVDTVLKTASGFGGCNASLILKKI